MIYLDNNATTRPFPEVVETVVEGMTSGFIAELSQHDPDEVLESARTAIQELCGAPSSNRVVFTSGATEANSWAVSAGAEDTDGWLLSTEIEHSSVRETLMHFARHGRRVRWLPVTSEGVVDLDALADLIDDECRFVSIILAHNETGVIQPLREAALIVRKHSPGCLIHADATQAFGKMPLDFSDELEAVDLVSFSGHKFHGPRGIGGLIIREGASIEPLIRGGGQQNNLRSGTPNLPAIAGIAIAAKRCGRLLEAKRDRVVEGIRNHLEARITVSFPDAFIAGKSSIRLPNTSFFGIDGTDAVDLVYALAARGVIVGKGSACNANSIEPPKSVLSMGYSYNQASAMIRFSAAFDTVQDEVDEFVDVLQSCLEEV